MQKSIKIFFVVLLTFFQIKSHASERNLSPEQARQKVRDMVKNIVVDNEIFQVSHCEEYFREQAIDQWPRVTIVACADSRVHTSNFDFQPLGDVFFIRNIGNQIEPCLGSIDYSMRHLKTPLLLFLGHSRCGAVKVVTQGTSKLEQSIQKELSSMCLKHHTPNPTEEQIAENVERNVHNQVNKACIRYEDLISQGVVWVVGAVYDFTPQGHGKLKVIQVNDQTDERVIADFLEDAKKNGSYCTDPKHTTHN